MASPPLAAGSGGEGSSGSAGPDPSDRQLSALFEQAAERLPALLPNASKEQLLYLYARYKQVKFGTCNTPKPGFFDFEGKQKWEAWKALGDTSPHQAMQEYVATVKKLDPSWNPQTTEKRGKESKTAFGGPVVSSLYQEETIRLPSEHEIQHSIQRTLPQLGYWSKSSLHIFVSVSMRTLLMEDLKMTTAPNNYSKLTVQNILCVLCVAAPR